MHFMDVKRVGLVEYCFMKFNDKLMLGFEENQSRYVKELSIHVHCM